MVGVGDLRPLEVPWPRQQRKRNLLVRRVKRPEDLEAREDHAFLLIVENEAVAVPELPERVRRKRKQPVRPAKR